MVFWGVVLLSVSCLIVIPSSSGGEEKYPTRPVNLVIPYSAGGSFDIVSRVISSVANEYLGQPLIVNMKPGGGAVIGTAFVARGKPNGYTLLFAGNSSLTIACQIEDTGYTKEDFIPIAKINHLPYVVAVRADRPWKSLEDLLSHMRPNPKKVIFGATGIPGLITLGNEMLLKTAKIEASPPIVPFKGVGDQVLSILKGDTDYMVQIYLGLVPFIKSKEIRVLAVLDDKRLPLLPDVPTAKELGYDLTLNMWETILVPKGTPDDIVEKLSTAFAKIVKDPSFVAMMEKMEIPIMYQDRGQFQKFWDDEYKKYGELIDRLGLKKKK